MVVSEFDGSSLNSAATGSFLTLAEVAGSEGCSSGGSFQIHHLLATKVGLSQAQQRLSNAGSRRCSWELSSEPASAALGELYGHIIPHLKSYFL